LHEHRRPGGLGRHAGAPAGSAALRIRPHGREWGATQGRRSPFPPICYPGHQGESAIRTVGRSGAAMKGKAMAGNQKLGVKGSRPVRWRGLQARMTFSYVWVTITAVFLLELVIIIFLSLVVGTWYSTAVFPQMAMQVARQYALAATLQANGTSL